MWPLKKKDKSQKQPIGDKASISAPCQTTPASNPALADVMNRYHSLTTSPPLYFTPDVLLPTPWRDLDWGNRNEMKAFLRKFPISTPDVKYLRILVHGPVGAGKSSFINSIDSIFQERITTGALAEAATDHSFTKTFQTHLIKDQKYGSFVPFVICDIMGLEGGQSEGVETDDLIKVLQGHIKDNYTFNPTSPCSEKDFGYNSSPRLSDRIHCLVSVVPAHNISSMEDAVIDKMKAVRARAGAERIPQVAVLTKVDEMCPCVAEDTKLVYRSKKIKEKMQVCSNRLGVPMNCIFPVKCYHEEIDLNDDVDVLLLCALSFILNAANDHVAVMAAEHPTVGAKDGVTETTSSAVGDEKAQMAEDESPPTDKDQAEVSSPPVDKGKGEEDEVETSSTGDATIEEEGEEEEEVESHPVDKSSCNEAVLESDVDEEESVNNNNQNSMAGQMPPPSPSPPPAGPLSSPPQSPLTSAERSAGPPSSPPQSPLTSAERSAGPPPSPPQSPLTSVERSSPPQSPLTSAERSAGPPPSPPQSPLTSVERSAGSLSSPSSAPQSPLRTLGKPPLPPKGANITVKPFPGSSSSSSSSSPQSPPATGRKPPPPPPPPKRVHCAKN